MLSFGIEASRALRIARSSAGFPSGSPPPSRAATVIARVSFENWAPRRESTIAFLCLMLDHLECPDMHASLRKGGGPAGAGARRGRPRPIGFEPDEPRRRPRHLQGLRRARHLRRADRRGGGGGDRAGLLPRAGMHGRKAAWLVVACA